MDLLLTILGVLVLGALLIAVWIFASAARRYVTGEDVRAEMEAMQSDLSPYRHWVDRQKADRRRTPCNVFPITVDGVVIREDRRRSTDRRRAA